MASAFPGDATGTNSAWQVANDFDLVPTLWVGASIAAAENWYPGGPEAQQTTCIESLLGAMKVLPGIHSYVQPAVTAVPLNQDQSVMDPGHLANTDADFLAQVGFQHANNIYLTLLAQATGVSPVPWITPCPGVPGAVAAVAGGGMLCKGAPPSFAITLYWTPPAPDPASVLGAPTGAPTGYAVMRSTTSGSGYTQAGTVSAGVTTFVDSGLPPQTTYYYVVQAWNGSGWSPVSAEVTATTGKPSLSLL